MANLSQAKRHRMLEFLHKIKEEHKDDDSILIALGEIESELTAKKYGLVWEQHEEAVDVMMRDNIPVFTEDMDRKLPVPQVGSIILSLRAIICIPSVCWKRPMLDELTSSISIRRTIVAKMISFMTMIM